MNNKIKVLIAGIGGASLGTELLKCLILADRYRIFGCDISGLAFGHYQQGFEKTFLADEKNYIESLINICVSSEIRHIIPGGEQPLALLCDAKQRINKEGITLVSNSVEVTKNFSNKNMTLKTIGELGFNTPQWKHIISEDDLSGMKYPCVLKPSTGSGGSNMVYLAASHDEAARYAGFMLSNKVEVTAQEYIPADEGEFTVGVLSLPDKRVISSIALKRAFNSKLSVMMKTGAGLISSGYSQGLIGDYPEICSVCEEIAKKIGSAGPLNIQGRLKHGKFLPFEINPRFSASTYLRAMAGLNEVDIFLHYLSTGELINPGKIKTGYYLRSLSEIYVEPGGLAK